MADSGFSGAQIAMLIGGVSRNSIMGIAMRNGIKLRGLSGNRYHGSSAESDGSMPVPRRSRTRISIVSEILKEPVDAEYAPLMQTFEDNAGCWYPFGDTDFRFCGLPKVEGISYCRHCAKLAFRPPEYR
jgi:hypothetical protein